MNEKINLTKSDGSSVTADIICFLENNTGKRYVYYTLNEVVGAGANSTVKIYVAKIAQNNAALDTPIDDAEWNKLKGYMSDALKGNANSEIKYVPLNELGTPTSVSEKAIAMPISYDYINKQRGIYAENVANAAPEATAVPEAQPAQAEPAPAVETPVANDAQPAPAETPVESAPVVEPTPIIPETPNVFDAPQPEVVTTPEAPLEPVVQPEEPVIPETPAPQPVIPVTETEEGTDSTSGSSATLAPINIADIEQKYAEMVETINKLKEQELEAAKRYNATLELSAMHNEQHANYVQSEQSKEVASAEAPIVPEAQPAPVEAPAPVTVEQPAAPTPTSDANLETNWFDMPSS